MARTFQLDQVAGLLLDPNDVLPVDQAGSNARRASQAQLARSLLSQLNDGLVTFPPGSYGAQLGGGTGGAGSITDFHSTPGPIVETGVTVTNPVLSWALSPMTVTSQALAGPLATSLTASQLNVTLTGSLTATATWALTVTGSVGVLTRNHTLSFGHTIHWGRGATTLTTSAAILALTGSKLATVPDGNYAIVANPGSTPYWWFCYPDSWGPVLIVDVLTSLPVAISDAGIVTVTNASGHVRAFRCLRSLNALNGAMTIRVS
jgi:hypothetical protein